VTAVAAAVPRAVSSTRVTAFLLLSTFFCVTFEKVHWNVAGSLGIADVLTVLFLLAFALTSRGVMPRTTAILLAFFAAFLLVYLAGFFNLDTRQGVDQFTKGMVKFVLHFLFLAASVTYLVQRGKAFYWRTVGWFMAGFAANGVYGVLQLLSAKAGHNLDHTVLSPLTGGASSINVYGSVGGTSVYRPNALTGDPNHLGVMLVVPLLSLLPVYLRLERKHRLRKPLAVTLAARNRKCRTNLTIPFVNWSTP
jgi:ABC-type multidrug transport system fused ATPase/permease subunit